MPLLVETSDFRVYQRDDGAGVVERKSDSHHAVEDEDPQTLFDDAAHAAELNARDTRLANMVIGHWAVGIE